MNILGAKAFWEFVRERHAIYVRRFVERRPPPWTRDPYLATNHFTNIYRQLDPGTVFIMAELERHAARSPLEKVLNVWLYRFALREESWTEMGWVTLEGFSGAGWGARLGVLKARWKAEEVGSVYHGAYYINNYGKRPIPKHEAIGLMAELTAEALRGTVGADLLAAETREAWAVAARKLTGFGDFLTNQVLADLTYDDAPGGKAFPLPEEGYVLLGTGARRGLRVVAGLHQDDKTLGESGERDVLELLWTTQPEIPGAVRPRLTRMNLQNCCCEFSKWNRLVRTDGAAGSRRVFSAEERWRPASAQGRLL